MINVESLVQAAKDKYPGYYAGMDDEEIYHVVRKRYPNLEWPESSPYDVDREVNPNKESLDASKQDYSPSAWEKIALAGLPEIWADKHDFAKRAYNNSMAGLIYQTMHGKTKYEVDEYDTPIWEDAASFFFGLASIPDIALFAGTGGLGGFAGKEIGKRTVVKSIQNGMAKATTAKVRDKLFARKMIAEAGMESGFSLGTYGAAGGALAESARQSSEGIEDFDYGKIVGEGAKAFVSGAIIGAAAGGVAKGIMSPKFAKAAIAAKAGNNSFKNLSTRILNSPGAQVLAEGQLFTAGQLTEQGLIHGQEISMDDYFRGVFTNTGIIGGMRASTKIFRLGQNDMTRYKKAKRKHYADLKKKYGSVYDNVVKEMESAGLKPPPELMDQMVASNLEGQEQEGFFRWVKNQEKDLFSMIKDKDFKNLSPKEQAKAVQGWVALNNIYIDMYDKLIKDKPLRDTMFEAENGTVPTEGQSKAQLKKYEALLESHKQISKFNGEFGLGDNKKGNETVSKIAAKEGVEVDIKTKTVAPKISYEKLSDDQLVKIAADKRGISFEQAREEFTGIQETPRPGLPPTRIKVFDRAGIIDYLKLEPPKAKKGFAPVMTSDELHTKYEEHPSLELRNKSTDIANELDRQKISYDPISDTKLNESHYDIQEIATNYFPTREVKKGARAKADIGKTILVESVTDIAYLKHYAEFAKYLDNMGKSIREATYDDVRTFVLTSKSGSNDALAILYRRLNSKGVLAEELLRASVGEIQGIKAGVAEKPLKGLRIEDIDKEGNVQIVPSKSMIPKEVPTSSILKKLLKKIMPEETPEAGTTIYRSIDGKAINGNKLTQIVKKYFGGKISSGDFRKALSQYIASTYSVDGKEWATIESIGLGHRQAMGKTQQRAYIKDIKLAEEYIKLRDEFVDKIFNKEPLEERLSGEYAKGGITVEQLRNGFDKLFAEGETIKIGGKNYSKDTLETMFRYMIETSPRPQDVVPIKPGDIFKKVVKRIKPEEEIIEVTPPEVKIVGERGALEVVDIKPKPGSKPNPDIPATSLTIDGVRYKFKKGFGVDESLLPKEAQESLAKREVELKKMDAERAEAERETLAPEGKVTPATKAQVERRNKWASEKYPEIEVKLVDKLEPTADGREVLGELVEHTARIVKGKAPADAIPHELTHHVINVLEAVGTPEAKQLIRDAVRTFEGKEEAVTKIGQLVSGRLEKGLVPKAKAWVKRFNIFLKNLFGSPIKGKDAAFLLGEMVYKRKGIPTAVSPKGLKVPKREMMAAREEYDTPEMHRKVVKRTFETATKHLASNDRKKLVSYILKDVLGVPAEKFKKLIYRTPENMSLEAEKEYRGYLDEFNNVIATTGVEKLRRMKDVTKFFSTIRQIENLETGERMIRNITESHQRDMLISLGVKDGDIWKSTQTQLEDYRHQLHQIAVSEEMGFSYDGRDFIFADKKPLTKYRKIVNEVKGMVLPFVDVVDAFGLKSLANRLKDHASIETSHFGEGYQYMNYEIVRGHTRKTKGGEVIEVIEPLSGATILGKNKTYEKLKDGLSIVDHRGEMYLDAVEWLKTKGSELSPKDRKALEKQISFFEKSIKPEWKKTIKAKGLDGDALNAVDANGKFKYIDIKTDEGKIVARYADPVKGMPRYYRNAFLKSLQAHINEAQYEAYKKNGDIKWIEDGIYISRITTKDFKNAVDLNSTVFEKLIEKQMSKIMIEEARREYKVLNPTMEQLNEFREFARGMAIGNLMDANSFSINKFSTKFFMRRHQKLPMFIKNDEGEWIRTYEHKFDNTVKRYALGMSKYVAGVETFPEFGKIPGMNLPGVKVEIAELKDISGKDWADWIQESVDAHLGIGKNNPFNMSTSALRDYANLLAKTQLSNPLSGVKNAFLAVSQAAWAFDVLDIGRGMADVFREENRIYVTKTGAKHLGTRHYEGGKFDTFMDKTLFKWGLMRPSEGWARNFSVLTGKIDQKKHIELLRSSEKGSKKYKKAENRLKEFYELNEADVRLLEEYGYGHGKSLDGHEFASKFEQTKMERKMETVHQRMNHMAHIKTQGASLSLFMPKAASGPWIKPLTLYKRMAYAATINTFKNAKEAIKSGNYMRIVAGSMATYFTGASLLGLYSMILGTPIPKENSGWWESFKTTLWRGEFLGLLSEFFSPFGESARSSLSPAIMGNARSLVTNFTQVVEGKKHIWGRRQGLDSYLRSLVAIYNAGQHVIERRSNPYNNGAVKFSKLYGDFEEEIYPNKPNMEFEATTKTPYYIMFQNAFNKGNSKEFSKAFVLTYYALASDYYNKGFEINGVRHYSMNMAYKKASQMMKAKMKALNPNRGRTSPRSETQTKAKEYSWYKWLAKDKGKGYEEELILLEGDYKRRLAEFTSQLPHYFRKNNLKDLHKEFDWIHKL